MEKRGETHALRWARWKWEDPFTEGRYTWCLVSVMPPVLAHPHCSVLFKLGTQVIRARSVAELMALITIPYEHVERLLSGEKEANRMADQMESDLRRMMELRRLPPGVKLLRSDTGREIEEEKAAYVSEAERIVKVKP